MHFGRPDNLYFLLLLVPMIGAFGGFLWWKRRVRARIGHLPLVNEMASAHSPARQITRAVLVMLAFALICVACARPQWGQDDRTIKRFGVDVVFALDLSKSMLAKDIPPSRLDAAKKEISETLKTMQGNRVGLVVFTAVSFAQSPLTADYGAIDFYLNKLDPTQMPMGGTAVGPAMLDSIELLTGKEAHIGAARTRQDAQKTLRASRIKRAKNQVIVLITDGEDHESAPLDAAKVAKENGIHVVTVGIGSVDGSRIPVYNEQGNLSGYQRNQKGELVHTSLDEKTLKKVAGATGGTYVYYSGKNSVVNGVSRYIDHLEKTELESMLREHYKERFIVFLVPAFLLLLLAMLLGERRRGAGHGVGSPSRSKAAKKGAHGSATLLILMVLLLGSVGLSGCDDTFRNTLDTVDQANKLVDQEDYAQAMEKYHEAETEVPATPELHYNLGIGLLGEQKYDDARQAFARALATQDPELRFDILFNMGLTFAHQEKWKEALDTYKQALGVKLDATRPANTERLKQGRHNLEVVFRKLFPPCAELEDDSEPNDAPGSAASLDKNKKEDRTLCGLNDDWYKLPIIPGSKVSVTATFAQLRDEPDPEHVFLTRPEDLKLSALDAAGEHTLAVDPGSSKGFDPATTHTTRKISDLRVTPEMLPGGNDQLLLKVAAGEYREFGYDLEVTAIPPCHALEDDFEPNENAGTAASIEAGNQKLHICPGNEDWFKVDMQMGDSLFVDLQVAEDLERKKPANLSVEILRADTHQVVASGRLEPPYLTAGIQDVADPGTYLIHVSGQTDDEQGPYTADVYHYEPCVIGNDRFEPNNTAQAAKDVDPNAEQLRYLRLCDGDFDYFKLPAPPPADPKKAQRNSAQGKTAPTTPPSGAGQAGDKKNLISWALTRVDKAAQDAPNPTPTPQSPAGASQPTPLALDLLSPSGNQVVAAGVKPEDPRALGPLNSDAPEVALLPDQIIHFDNADKQQLLLRAQGPATFYHLRQLNPKNANQDEQQKDKDKSKNDEQSDEQKENENKDKDSDKDGDKDEQEKKKDGEKDDSDQGDKDEDPSEKQESDQSDKDKKKKQDAAAEDSSDEAMTPEERHTEDILRALEESDDNFQMKKALENMPRRHIEKDW